VGEIYSVSVVSLSSEWTAFIYTKFLYSLQCVCANNFNA